MTGTPAPFQVRISDEAIADLRDRLRRTRWPEPATADGWAQGAPLAYARELCHYWADRYDFAAAERRLARRAGHLDRREVPRLDRPRRRPRVGPRQGPAPRQPHALLAARHRSLRRPPLYWESFAEVQALFRTGITDVVPVPTGCSVFPRELPRPSRRWARRRFPDIRYWNEPSRGGHFAAFEQPALFVEEVRACARALR